MANHNKSRYSKRRVKVKKQDPNRNPFDKELKSTRNKKIVGIVALLIVVVMIGTMFLPYITGGQDNINYKLPEEVLKAEEDTSQQVFSQNSISVGQTFTRSEDDYYVVFGSQEDMMNIQTELFEKNIYLVDASLLVNASLTKDLDQQKKSPTKPSEIKIKDSVALIRIKDGKTHTFLNTKAAVNQYIEKIK